MSEIFKKCGKDVPPGSFVVLTQCKHFIINYLSCYGHVFKTFSHSSLVKVTGETDKRVVTALISQSIMDGKTTVMFVECYSMDVDTILVSDIFCEYRVLSGKQFVERFDTEIPEKNQISVNYKS